MKNKAKKYKIQREKDIIIIIIKMTHNTLMNAGN